MSRASGGAWGYAHVCMINAGGIRNQINPGSKNEKFHFYKFLRTLLVDIEITQPKSNITTVLDLKRV